MCLLVLLKGKFLCLFLVLVLCRVLVLWPCTSLGPCTLAGYFCRGWDLGGLLRGGFNPELRRARCVRAGAREQQRRATVTANHAEEHFFLLDQKFDRAEAPAKPRQ